MNYGPFFSVSPTDEGFLVTRRHPVTRKRLTRWVPGTGTDVLRKALIVRNELYVERPFSAKAISLLAPTMNDERSRTNTGYARITHLYHRGKPLFQVLHRSVETGCQHVRRFPYRPDGSGADRSQALTRALAFRRDNMRAVRPIIEAYNEATRTLFLEQAEREVEDLWPRLHDLQVFSPSRWLSSRNQVEGVVPDVSLEEG